MDVCLSIGGPALCTVFGLVALLDLGVLFVIVLPTQGWLLRRRLRKPGHWHNSKTTSFYAIGLENLAMFLLCILPGKISPVLHLLFDYSQFLLFTCIFYYFTLHTFQIMGRIHAIRVTVYVLTTINLLYLSGFTVYFSIQMTADQDGSYCKISLWLAMRASACAVSLLLVVVGIFASHYLNHNSQTLTKRREVKLWTVIVIILISTFLQLIYDTYSDIVRPNKHCLGLLPVTSMQSGQDIGNAFIWLINRLVCNFSVDVACMHTFWPVRKVMSPVLMPADNEDLAIRSILNPAVKSSIGSDSNVSWEDEDRGDRIPGRS